eukprot:TRINITY_DN641_c0_g1_i1.p1 TRINITY_DN641_c0_g1~~TRINITY_DN641_c0_g1_i1.p1  ORF type:complete len:546 (+),score=81.01 TRINITY_DN641_c0_g1_i1:219-1856(+)
MNVEQIQMVITTLKSEKPKLSKKKNQITPEQVLEEVIQLLETYLTGRNTYPSINLMRSSHSHSPRKNLFRRTRKNPTNKIDVGFKLTEKEKGEIVNRANSVRLRNEKVVNGTNRSSSVRDTNKYEVVKKRDDPTVKRAYSKDFFTRISVFEPNIKCETTKSLSLSESRKDDYNYEVSNIIPPKPPTAPKPAMFSPINRERSSNVFRESVSIYARKMTSTSYRRSINYDEKHIQRILAEQEKRSLVERELVTTERNYLRDLKVIFEVFQEPISDSKILSDIELQSIFSPSLDSIIGLSEILLEKISAASANHTSIGEIFIEMVDYFRTYATYINNFDIAVNTIKSLKKSNPEFRKFILECQRKRRCRKQTLEDFMIIIIQRIPRYVLLLSDLLKYTNEENEIDYLPLSYAIEKVRKLASWINTEKSNTEKSLYTLEIMEELGVKNVPAERQFISEDIIYKKLPTEEISCNKYCKLFIFSDFMFVARYKDENFVSVKKYPISKLCFECGKEESQIKLNKDVYYLSNIETQAKILEILLKLKEARPYL